MLTSQVGACSPMSTSQRSYLRHLIHELLECRISGLTDSVGRIQNLISGRIPDINGVTLLLIYSWQNMTITLLHAELRVPCQGASVQGTTPQ